MSLIVAANLVAAGDPPPSSGQAPVVQSSPMTAALPAPATWESPGLSEACQSCCCDSERRPFESDRAFPRFIGPMTNPVLSKDPRALTEARLLFVNNQIDPASPLGDGSFQAYGLQVRVALTDRLSFIADKDGYLVIHPAGGPTRDGFADIAVGLKYAFIRDVENQFLFTGGFMFEPQTGEEEVFQGHGEGLFTFFVSTGKEINEKYHVLGNFGYQVPVDTHDNSSFFYLSLHADREFFGWLYPLLEVNWFHWVTSGQRGLPPALGEGDGLINLGTSGVAGNDLVSMAVGLKARLGQHADTGVAWEFPVSNRHDLLNNRITAEFIIRY
jgi:hypothetical protein